VGEGACLDALLELRLSLNHALELVYLRTKAPGSGRCDGEARRGAIVQTEVTARLTWISILSDPLAALALSAAWAVPVEPREIDTEIGGCASAPLNPELRPAGESCSPKASSAVSTSPPHPPRSASSRRYAPRVPAAGDSTCPRASLRRGTTRFGDEVCSRVLGAISWPGASRTRVSRRIAPGPKTSSGCLCA
jgi:hypothetical protein